MRSLLRSTVLAGAVVVTTLAGTAPASAEVGVLSFEGEVYINCFGCGDTTGWADLRLTGLVGTVPLLRAPAVAQFSAFQPYESPQCLLTGAAFGWVSGPVEMDFNWIRLGAVAMITTSGAVTGAGTAVFAVTDPIGIPCWQPVRATVAGAIAGI